MTNRWTLLRSKFLRGARFGLLALVLVGSAGAAPRPASATESAARTGSTISAPSPNLSPPAPRAPSAVPSPVDLTPSPRLSPVAAHSPSWELTRDRGTIKGFLDRVSARGGDTLGLYVTTPAASFDVTVYRLGWYAGGAEAARLVTTVRGLPGGLQPDPTRDLSTGLVSAANWRKSADLVVGDWPTGLYLLKLVAADGDDTYVPLVVRDDRPHDFLFVTSATTDEAYNDWGGASLYGSTILPNRAAGVKASFDRPFSDDGSGAGTLSWELDFARFLEANGFDVGYAADVDLNRPDFDRNVRAVLVVGHDEYWSKDMRDNLEAARDRGAGLGFFSGDTGTWAARFEDSPLGAERVVACYRDDARDPVAANDPARATVRFRDPPLNRPTQRLLGLGSYGAVRRSADWTVVDPGAAPDLFAGTGFQPGDTVANLIGYEYDGVWTPGKSSTLAPGSTILGQGAVEPQVIPPESLSYAVELPVPDGRPVSPGHFSTRVKPEGSWTLDVRLKLPNALAVLRYLPENGRPAPSDERGRVVGSIPIGESAGSGDWRPVERDLAADYVNAVGAPLPTGTTVESVVVRGSVTVGPMIFGSRVKPDWSVTFDAGSAPASQGWRLIQGQGTVSVDARDPDGASALTTRVTLAGNQRSDVSQTIVLRAPGKGVVVAVGTIQWAWALDAFGHHVDAKGNLTPVDPRVQALTRNLLRALKNSRSQPKN